MTKEEVKKWFLTVTKEYRYAAAWGLVQGFSDLEPDEFRAFALMVDDVLGELRGEK